MFDVIIPLRTGSRGIKDKNVVKFKNTNLTNYTIKKLLKIKLINRIFILTDSKNYKNKILKNKKIDLSYKRPKKFSKSNSSIYYLITDFIRTQKYNKKKELKNILLLQVTSPLISGKEIIKTLRFIKKKKLSSLFHVSEMVEHPQDCIKGDEKKWKPFFNKKVINRQNYYKNYNFITGSLFFFTKDFFEKYRVTYNKSSYAYKVDKINFVDIDDKFDLAVAKKLVNSKIRN